MISLRTTFSLTHRFRYHLMRRTGHRFDGARLDHRSQPVVHIESTAHGSRTLLYAKRRCTRSESADREFRFISVIDAHP
jgi:hypothetical protein